MKHLYRHVGVFFVAASLAALLGCQRSPASGPHWAPLGDWVEIETFTGTTTHLIDLPGKSDERGGVTYTGTTRWGDLKFTSGAVEYGGQQIDLAGLEEDLMATRYSGTVFVPETKGPADVKVRGQIHAEGYAFPEGFSGSSSANGLRLGKSFSGQSLGILQDQDIEVEMTALNVQSPLAPELQGDSVRLVVEKALTKVDAANGIMEIRMRGRVLARPGRG